MTIQFNTDRTISGSESTTAHYKALLSDELNMFSAQLTRIEVHLSDENGKKEGLNDIRCMIEARLEGKQPIAVTNQADTAHQSISGAIEKLKTVLENIVERERPY